MPVIPCRTNLFNNDTELYQFLLDCQEQSVRQGNSLIVSLAREIDPIDPLSLLGAATKINSRCLHFYWENCSKQEAFVAIGRAKSMTFKTGNRFERSQKFIQKCLQKMVKFGDLNLPGSGPHFFANFTFFDRFDASNSPFPPATVFLPEFQVTRKQNCCVLTTNLNVSDRANLNLIIQQLKHQAEIINLCGDRAALRFSDRPLSKITCKAQVHRSEKFTSAVASALKSIEDKQLSKIVLAHSIDVIAPSSFQVIDSLHNLRQHHPDCYVFSTSNGEGTNFIGASPERLISIQDRQLIADALAGSAPRGTTAFEDASFAKQLLKSEKEKREHQAVSNFIDKRLCELGLTPTRSPLTLLQLSNIQHLWTPIHAELPDRIHPLDIVAKLHPTPAVAGVPTPIACHQICRHESFDRSLYAAPIGWVDYQGNGEFIVGIRSAFIKDNHARLYAGAGIVSGSNPDKELAEVLLKFQTMLKALV